MRKRIALLLLHLPIYCIAQEFGGHPASVKWQQTNTAHSRVIFPIGLDSQARRIQEIITRLDNVTAASIGGKAHKWNVLLLNQTTVPNAYVRMAPVMSEFFMTPGQDNFSTGSLRWDDNLVIHENRHMQQFSNFNNGITKAFSFLLGEEGQLLANGMAVPDYFFEGDAVWQETLVSNQGRGRMPSFFNGMKALWLDNKNYSWMKLRSGSLKDFVPDHYALGYPLVAYGYETYGVDFWKKVTQDATRFKGLFYPFIRAIEQHSGVSYEQFRTQAISHFRSLMPPAEKSQAEYITAANAGNVIDYSYPQWVGVDSIIVTRQSYREPSAFYLLTHGTEQKIRVKNYVLDEYFSYRNGKLVYASFMSDPRWQNRNYSVINVLDIQSGNQRQLTFQSKYFSPDLAPDGSELIAVDMQVSGKSFLHRLNAETGAQIAAVANPMNLLYTQTKYLDAQRVVSAVRLPDGRMALAEIQLHDGALSWLVPPSWQVLGFPSISGDTIYFSMADPATGLGADRIFAVNRLTKNIFRVTNNVNSVYAPVALPDGSLLAAAVTASGQRLRKFSSNQQFWEPYFIPQSPGAIPGCSRASLFAGAGMLNQVDSVPATAVSSYRKTHGFFNFHSARPWADDPEWGYQLFGNNVLSSTSNTITFSYNPTERSNALAYDFTYGGFFTQLHGGATYRLNRNIDTAVGRGIQFNSAEFYLGASLPFHFVGGRTIKSLTLAAQYDVQQIPYIGIGKDVFSNHAFRSSQFLFAFSNASRSVVQQIFPAYAQAFSIRYRNGYTFYKNKKWVGAASLYWPGLRADHSLVLNGAFQTRDTLPDLFSNSFPYARGYQALSTRKMYKWGVNYHFTLGYPDWGIGNIFFFQRIRANAFYDYNIARARLNGRLTDIVNRSTGGEIYFDGKIWNSLPASFGIRYSHLLDTDLRNPQATGRWEFILPINLIPD